MICPRCGLQVFEIVTCEICDLRACHGCQTRHQQEHDNPHTTSATGDADPFDNRGLVPPRPGTPL